MVDFSRFRFHPVIILPPGYEVYDFTSGYDPHRPRASGYGIGKYDEKRVGMYQTPLFEGRRDIHMGVDIAAPVGTPVHAFHAGRVWLFGYNGAEGDYGHTLVTEHDLGGVPLFALHGHLSAESLRGKVSGQKFAAGEVIAWIGDEQENGGWNPHLHFQLSWARPSVADMPGVVSDADREDALRRYPDPRLVLGPIY